MRSLSFSGYCYAKSAMFVKGDRAEHRHDREDTAVSLDYRD
ncbi:hypothetical protein [Oscillatoria nigro-viridis]|nr:hypothetical protein [Oscillatoria nigro-viridis]